MQTYVPFWIRPAWSSLEPSKKWQHFLLDRVPKLTSFVSWTGSGFCWVGRTPLPKFLLSTHPGPQLTEDINNHPCTGIPCILFPYDLQNCNKTDMHCSFIIAIRMLHQQIVITALLHPKCMVKFPKKTIYRNYKIMNKRLPAWKNLCRTCHYEVKCNTMHSMVASEQGIVV